MSKRIKPDELSSVIEQELTIYSDSVMNGVRSAVRKSTRQMVTETKAQRFKQDTGDYRKSIASRTEKNTPNAMIMQWYVKAPHYRLSHLLEFGHATPNGRRTIAYGFIGKAEANAIETLDKAVEEAIKNG